MIIRGLPERKGGFPKEVLESVLRIIEEVRRRGDEALIEFTERFDGVRLDSVRASREELEEQAGRLEEGIAKAIDVIAKHLEEFNKLTLPQDIRLTIRGFKCELKWIPVESVGVYVPGGRRLYPSTALMTLIPAKAAGVRRLFMASPTRTGHVDPALAYIALRLGVEAVYKIGGAQAIAAFAYGTQSVVRVDKIIGPGNIFVQAAKYLVSQEVAIDGVEGPTELVVLADKTCDPRRIALDLEAQGEHGRDTLLIVISTSREFLDELELLLRDRQDIVVYLKGVGSIEEGVELVNELAPEHVLICTENARHVAMKIRNAGVIAIGNTPPAVIDYAAGPSHVLPTLGHARTRGGLSVYDFLKLVAYVEALRPDDELIDAAVKLARYEGFEAHARSIIEGTQRCVMS